MSNQSQGEKNSANSLIEGMTSDFLRRLHGGGGSFAGTFLSPHHTIIGMAIITSHEEEGEVARFLPPASLTWRATMPLRMLADPLNPHSALRKG